MFDAEIFQSDAVPLFIIGVPRSGTTFLHQVVNSHSQVCITDELRVVSWLFGQINKLREGFLVHGDPYPFNHGEDFAKYLARHAGTLIRPFYQTLAIKEGKRKLLYWGDKYPHYDEILEHMPLSFPRAKYLMIHRDLRDTVCSVEGGHKWDIKKSSQYVSKIYARYITKISGLLESGSVTANNILHVEYETLWRHTSDVAIWLFKQLGLDTSTELSSRILELRDIQSHSVRKKGGVPIAYNAGVTSIGRWKTDLTESDLLVLDGYLSGIKHELDQGRKWIDQGYSAPGNELTTLPESGISDPIGQ